MEEAGLNWTVAPSFRTRGESRSMVLGETLRSPSLHKTLWSPPLHKQWSPQTQKFLLLNLTLSTWSSNTSSYAASLRIWKGEVVVTSLSSQPSLSNCYLLRTDNICVAYSCPVWRMFWSEFYSYFLVLALCLHWLCAFTYPPSAESLSYSNTSAWWVTFSCHCSDTRLTLDWCHALLLRDWLLLNRAHAKDQTLRTKALS